jgi:hypothetical protein
MTVTAASVPVSAPAAPAAAAAAPVDSSSAVPAPAAPAAEPELHRVGGRIRAKWDPAPLPATAPAAPGEAVSAPTLAPAEPAKPAAAPAAQEKPAAPGPDEGSELLADINRIRRDLNAERARLRGKAEEHAKGVAALGTLAKASELLEAGKLGDAIRLLKADANVDALLLGGIEMETANELPLTQADIDARVKAHLEAERKAEADRAKAAGEAALSQHEMKYLTVCQQELDADPSKYPNLVTYEPKPGEAREFLMSYVSEHGHAPQTTETLQHFERVAIADKVSRLVRDGKHAEAAALLSSRTTAPAPAAPVAPSPLGGSTVMDTGGTPPVPRADGRIPTLAELKRESLRLIEEDQRRAAGA